MVPEILIRWIFIEKQHNQVEFSRRVLDLRETFAQGKMQKKHFQKNLNRPSGFHFTCLKLGKRTEGGDICFLAVSDTPFPVSLPVFVQFQRHWEPVAYTLLCLCFQAHHCPAHGWPGQLVTLEGYQCHLHCWNLICPKVLSQGHRTFLLGKLRHVFHSALSQLWLVY